MTAYTIQSKFSDISAEPIISIEINGEKHVHQFLTYHVIFTDTLK